MIIAEVFLNQKNKRIDHSYDYAIPVELEKEIKVGTRIVVPFGKGNRSVEGFVIALKKETLYNKKTKEIFEMIDKEPILLKEQINLCLWIKVYYCSLFYEALALFTTSTKLRKHANYFWLEEKPPKTLTEEWFFSYYFNQSTQNFIVEKKIKREDLPIFEKLISDGFLGKKIIWEKPEENNNTLERLSEKESKTRENPKVVLSLEEERCYHSYCEAKKINKKTLFFAKDRASKFRIYFKVIEEALAQNKGVVVLFPEINITIQRMELFKKYFGESVGIFHGKLKKSEQHELYQKVKNNEVRVLVGVKSGFFLPMEKIGLVIIDEEHDPTYTALGSPRLNIRDVAEKYCELTKAQLILGDEFPDVVSYYKGEKGVYNLIEIPGGQSKESPIKVIDMQNEIRSGNFDFLSRNLSLELKKRLDKKELSVFLINKKGYASALICRECGHVEKCPKCRVSLKYFLGNESLSCHYCGYTKKIPQRCAHCGSDRVRTMGFGIDQAEAIIRERFPRAKIVVAKGSLKPREIKKMNEALKKGDVDIFLGTHIVTKYFDFSSATLAGALLIDSDLNQGDYHASENVFQTYKRFFSKGMGEESLKVIQTSDPENETIEAIVHNDYKEFYESEINYREIMDYPPFGNLIIFGVFHRLEKEAEEDSIKLYLELKEGLKIFENSEYRLYRPTKKGFIQGGNNLFQIVIKIKSLQNFQRMTTHLIVTGKIEKLKSKVSIEINP
ncbi:MAG: replication restart helicase PriA [Eubacteriaceae bacterium]